MKMVEAQAAVAEYHASDAPMFNAGLGRLVDGLLRCASDDAITDGIVFGFEHARTHQFFGHGMAYMLYAHDYVEPVSVNLRFNPDANALISATILFGAFEPAKFKRRSRPGRNLAECVAIKVRSGEPNVDFDWKYKFTLVDGEWVSELLS